MGKSCVCFLEEVPTFSLSIAPAPRASPNSPCRPLHNSPSITTWGGAAQEKKVWAFAHVTRTNRRSLTVLITDTMGFVGCNASAMLHRRSDDVLGLVLRCVVQSGGLGGEGNVGGQVEEEDQVGEDLLTLDGHLA